MSRVPEDLTGRRFGKLTAVRLAARGPAKWECRCDCGNVTVVMAGNLKSGLTKSCGCLRLETARKPKGRKRAGWGRVGGVPYVSDEGNLSNLTKLRFERNMTCRQLAERVGVARSTIPQWETGAHIPNESRIAQLAEALNVGEQEVRCAIETDNRRRWGLEGFVRDHGLTLAALAEKAGVREETVVAWSNGASEPTLSQVRRLAGAMGVSVGKASDILAESRAERLLADNPNLDAHALETDLGCNSRTATSLINRFDAHMRKVK